MSCFATNWEQPESRRLEFKEEFPQGDQIAKTVVAFANGAGGKIVLGVRDNPRQITGISDDQLFALEELERQRRKISFDALPVYEVIWRDLDLTRFRSDYFKATGRKLTEKKFENLNLLIRDREQSYPADAAILLSDSPYRAKLFPFAKIECTRFKGTTTSVFLDQTTIALPIYLAADECIAFIKKNIALGSTIGEVYRKDRWEYPLEAIREAVVNAIIHRDYSFTGKDIKIASFDDMLEITSPGPLPDTMSLDDLGTGRSDIRNRVLAPIFKDLGLIEARGTGMQKIRQAGLKYPEIETVFQEAGLAFQVQFKKNEQPNIKVDPGRHQVGTKLAPSREQVGTKS